MRRRSKSNTQFPLTKTTGDIARNRGFLKPSEMRKAKRVRFDDAEADPSSKGHEATQSPRCGAPKTSEYAYFRKVKDGAVNGDQFRELYKEKEELKRSKLSYLLRETDKASEKLDPETKDLNFSISRERAGPSSHNLIVSPPARNYDESYGIRKKEITHTTKKRSALLTETVTPVGQSLFSSLLNQENREISFNLPCPENQCSEKGLFSETRKRLCQWVAHTTSSEVEKNNEKGCDLVSFLLCRLVPKENENHDSSKGDADNSSKSPTIQESDNLEKGLSLSHKRDWDKDLSKICSGRSNGIVLRERNRFDSEFPFNYRKENDLQNETMDRSVRSREIVLREWDGFSSRFPSNYHKERDLENEIMDHSGRSSESVLREWDGFGSRFPSNYHKERDLENEIMDHSGRSSESVLREWDGFGSRFPSNYHKERDIENKTMDHSGRSGEIVLREWDGFGSGFPSNYREESDLRNEYIDPDQHSNNRMCNSSDTQLGYSFCLPFKRFRSLDAFLFKDVDEFGPIIGHGREGPYRHSLDGTRKDVCHRLANAWNDDQPRLVDNVLNTKGFSPSPLLSRHHLFSSLPNYDTTGCLMHEVAPNFDDVKYAMVEPGHFSLALPSSPTHTLLAEDENTENLISNSNRMLSYSDTRWREKKVWDCMPRTDFLWKCLSAPELSAEDHPLGFHAWEFPQKENGSYSLSLMKEAPERPFTPFGEGAFDPYVYSSTLHSPPDRFMNCPLLLNHVSQDMLDHELYSDELGYRKML